MASGAGNASSMPCTPACTMAASWRYGLAAASAARNSKLNCAVPVDVAELGNRADANGRLAVAEAEIVEGGAPAMRRQAQIGHDAWRGDRHDASRYFRMPAMNWPAGFGEFVPAARDRRSPAVSPVRKLRWMCTPLPTQAGSRIGVKVTLRPSRLAALPAPSRA